MTRSMSSEATMGSGGRRVSLSLNSGIARSSIPKVRDVTLIHSSAKLLSFDKHKSMLEPMVVG